MRNLFFQRPLPAKIYKSYIQTRNLSSKQLPPIIRIKNATFYRDYPTETQVFGHDKHNNPPIYPNLNFTLSSSISSDDAAATTQSKQQRLSSQQHWAVIGSSDRSRFLQVLQGQYICIPPTARSYPLLATGEVSLKDPRHAIRYVGFNGDAKQGSGGVRGSYLSARYESRREETDFTVLQYLKGQTSLNPLEEQGRIDEGYTEQLLNRVISDLGMGKLVDMPLTNLSNGQTRRARIAKALLDKPEVLLLDDPFMGLDPPTVQALSPLLHNLSVKGSPRLVLSLRPQDALPEWITHLVILNQGYTVSLQGERSEVLNDLNIWKAVASRESKRGPPLSSKVELLPRTAQEDKVYMALSANDRKTYDDAENSRTSGQFDENTSLLHDLNMISKGSKPSSKRITTYGEPIVEMDGVQVKYGQKTVLGNWHQPIDGENKQGLFWKVNRGQRWSVFGLNGSGKTTLISLLTSDHPQAYAQPVRLFGRTRLPEPGKPGLSIFDLQSRIGHSSPEIHAFFPRTLSIRASIETAWSETFLSKPNLNQDKSLDLDSALRFFEADLNPDFAASSSPADISWATTTQFSTLTMPQQRLILFLRATIHKPDLIVLDEAFSGMSPSLRDKCLHFLEVGETLEQSTGSRRIPNFDVWHVPSSKSKGEMAPQTQTQTQPRHTGLSESQALIVISHVKEEVPDIVSHWMKLPSMLGREDGVVGSRRGIESNNEFRTGVLGDDQTVAVDAWDEIWGV